METVRALRNGPSGRSQGVSHYGGHYGSGSRGLGHYAGDVAAAGPLVEDRDQPEGWAGGLLLVSLGISANAPRRPAG